MDRHRFKNLRRRVWERDHGTCWICEEPVPLEVTTLDHILPKSKGGRAVFGNLRAAHEICNRERGDHPERTGKRGKGDRRAEGSQSPHRDPMTVTILDRLADGRPTSVKTVDGRIVWVEE